MPRSRSLRTVTLALALVCVFGLWAERDAHASPPDDEAPAEIDDPDAAVAEDEADLQIVDEDEDPAAPEIEEPEATAAGLVGEPEATAAGLVGEPEAAPAYADVAGDGTGEVEPGEMDPKVYAEVLRGIVRAKREAVLEKITDKVMAKQLARMDLVSSIFSIVSVLGLVVLVSPLWLRKKYPGKARVLWTYSALAALLFIVTINLFSGVLAVLRTGQMVAGSATNPQVQIVEATFDVVEEKAEDLAPMGPVIVEPTLAQLDGDSEEPLPVMLLQNVQRFKQDFTIFSAVANFFKGISWVFGYVPIVLSLVTVALFLLGLKPTLTAIVELPQRAAEGETGVAGRVTKATLRRVGWEFVTTVVVMLLLLVVMIGAGLLLAEALKPAIEAFLAYLAVSFLYVQLVPDASSAVVLVGLGGTVLFLVLDLAVVIMASALYIGKAHKIFQRRFHDKEPLSAHRRFWGWGTLCLLWVLAFPLLYILAAKPAVELLIAKTTGGEDIDWAFVLTSGPVVLVVAFLGLFVLLRGPRAIGFLAKYRVPKLGRPIGDVVPVRTGVTGPAPTIDDAVDFAHVPVRTGATRAYSTVGAARMPTTRYGAVPRR